jgi:protein-tyrosine phosphatase
MKEKTSVMFVCMGNICRSPTAHAVMQYQIDEQGLSNQFIIESSGTHAYHVGEPADRRAQQTAAKHGVDMSDLRAQKISVNDYDNFDWILVMDHENLELVEYYAPSGSTAQCRLLMDFAEGYEDQKIVPDPYYGGSEGFENVYSMVDQACAGFLRSLESPK